MRREGHVLRPELAAGNLEDHLRDALSDLRGGAVDDGAAALREHHAGGGKVVEALRVAEVLEADGEADAAADAFAARHVAGAAGQPNDDITSFIDDLIARITYYPSLKVQIASDAQGRLLAGTQPVVQIDEQGDGMVVLRTPEGTIWITHAAYDRLVA